MKKTLQKSFLEVLNQNFVLKKDPSVFFLWEEDTHVHFDLPVIRLQGRSDILSHLVQLIKDFETKEKELLISTYDVESKLKNIIGLGPYSTIIASWVKEIHELNHSYKFKRTAPFASSFRFDITKPELMIHNNGTPHFLIHTKEDVLRFNDYHMQLKTEIDTLKEKILHVAKVYDEKAHLDEEHATLKLFQVHFPLIFKKTQNEWNVWFFKKNFDVIKSPSLSSIESELLELADKFGREERFFDLYR